MRKRVSALLVAVAGVILTAACAESDADITAKVSSEIATDRAITSASHIDVSTHKRVVTLSGTAESQIAKDRALALARETIDVQSVIDNLKVVGPQASVSPNTNASAAPSAGSPEDSSITSTIQSKLKQDARVAGEKIDVETRLGIVTLSGTVKSEQAKRDAMQIAQDTAGVARVESQLRVPGS